MKLLISGASGLIGSALTHYFAQKGDTVYQLVRSQAAAASPNCIFWDPQGGIIDPSQLEGFDAVIHLAGDNVASGRWSAAKKQRIYNSRIEGTQLLARTLQQLKQPPQSFLCASAIGFYGDRGDTLLDESSNAGQVFISQTCVDWEKAARSVNDNRVGEPIRVALLRFGLVLSAKGGVLKKILPIFQLGLGGNLGSGRQMVSWIALDDAVKAVDHILSHPDIQGPVNMVAPNPVTNAEMTRLLGKVLKRPVLFPAPAFALKLALGGMADELLLASANVKPAVLQTHGFTFRHNTLEDALHSIFP